MDVDDGASQPSLAELQALVARQTLELDALRQQAAAGEIAVKLREGLRLAAVAGAAAAPGSYSDLLQLIVATAARVIGARRGSLFLVDEAHQDLVFEVALGEPIERFKSLRLPLGRGIAGLVALTGQAMAISDVASDPRHASEIAQLTGYTPSTLVCVPLAYGDRIIGVIELLDRLDGNPFSPSDIETLALFGTQAAITIDQSRTRRDVAALMTEALVGQGGVSPDESRALREQLRALLSGLEQDRHHARALEIAREVQAIAEFGELEAAACQAILRGFADYLRTRPHADSETSPRR
jgi:putative methionine-R-sulfoxide reductase with GAF domain